MKKIILAAFTICLTFTGCSSDELIKPKIPVVTKDDQSLKNEESKKLEKMYDEIVALSGNTKACMDNNDWDFTSLGSKSCGGPNEYIVYSSKINTTDFLAKVKTYTSEQEKFNNKWKIISTCDVVPVPESVDCVDGKATLVYGPDRNTEKENLKKMYDEIIALSGITNGCEGNWYFTAIGSKSCGGPQAYIPYSLKINTTDFLAKVNLYTAKQGEFNKKWKIFSTCDVVPVPESVYCVNGKATLIYQSDKITERQDLEKMYDEIITLSGKSKQCTDNKDWNFIEIGSKPCGGPQEYIPYSLKINTTDFIAKVGTYTSKQREFNQKWGMRSDCELIDMPKSVDCVDGKAKLIYN